MEFKKSYTIHLTNVLLSICCAVVPTLGEQWLKKNSALSVLKWYPLSNMCRHFSECISTSTRRLAMSPLTNYYT